MVLFEVFSLLVVFGVFERLVLTNLIEYRYFIIYNIIISG